MHDVPRSKIFDDIYFSIDDGYEESKYVFLDGNNLPKRFSDCPQFTICETGFGTGLNFLIAWQAFIKNSERGKLHFISFEKYPLTKHNIETALSGFFESDFLKTYLDHYPADPKGLFHYDFNDQIKLSIYFSDVNDVIGNVNEDVDAWFLDGFAPAKNPDMWSDILFENMSRLSKGGTTIATFTAAGVVKRGLSSHGFSISKVRGYGRKRDMITGIYNGG